MALPRLACASILAVALFLVTGTLAASADEAADGYGTLRIPASTLHDLDPYVVLNVVSDNGLGAAWTLDESWIRPGEDFIELPARGHVVVALGRGEHPGRTVTTYYPGVASVDEAADVEVGPEQTVTLRPFAAIIGATAHGRVKTSDGSPFRGVLEVRGYSVGRDGRLGDRQVGEIKPDGRFSVEGLDDGPAIFQAVGEGDPDGSPRYTPYVATWSGDVRSEHGAQSLDVRSTRANDVGTITLIDEGTLSGRAVDADGVPVAGAVVTSDGFRGELVTDADGRWDAGGVSEGRYSVGVVDPREHVKPVHRTVEVASGRPSVADTSAQISGPTWAVGPRWDADPDEVLQGTPITVSPGVLNQPDATITDISWVTDWGPNAVVLGHGARYTPPHGLGSPTRLYAIVTAERRGMSITALVESAEVTDADPFEGLMAKDDRRTVVHEVVTAGTRASSSSRETRRWQWLRDGKRISSATARTYRASPKDRGHRLSVRTTTTRSGGHVTRRTSRSAVVERGSTIIAPDIIPVEEDRLLARARVGVSNVDRRFADGVVVVQRVDASGPVDVARFPVRDGWGAIRFDGHPTGSAEYRMVFTPSDAAMSGATSVDIPVPGLDQRITFENSPWSRFLNNEIFGIDEGPEY